MPPCIPAKMSPGESSIDAGKEAKSNDRGETTPAALSNICAPGECGSLCSLCVFLAGVTDPIVTEDENGSSTTTFMPAASPWRWWWWWWSPVGGRSGDAPHGCESDSSMFKFMSIADAQHPLMSV